MSSRHTGNELERMNKLVYYIKNPNFLLIALFEGFGGWIPDKIYLRIIFFLHTGRKLHLDPPVTFNEKIQWLKLNDRKPLYTTLVDKSTVKEVISGIIGEHYIIPTLGVWERVEDIDYNTLPRKFVLKTTHDGGGSGVVICDKDNMDIPTVESKLRKSLRHNIYKTLREWPYKDIKPQIMAEQYIQPLGNGETGLQDYKFFCFNGEPKFCQVKTHENGHDYIDLFDLEWELLPFSGLNPQHEHSKIVPRKPENLKDMLALAQKLSVFAKFERVDFYNVGGRIYFGEITFYPASGMGAFTPKEYDTIVGNMLSI